MLPPTTAGYTLLRCAIGPARCKQIFICCVRDWNVQPAEMASRLVQLPNRGALGYGSLHPTLSSLLHLAPRIHPYADHARSRLYCNSPQTH